MSRLIAPFCLSLVALAGCSSEAVEKAASDSAVGEADGTSDSGEDGGGDDVASGSDGSAGDDGGAGEAGDGESGDGGDDGGADDAGDSSGDGGSGDGAETGGDGGGDHAYDGIWQVTFDVAAAIERSSGTIEGSCSGSVDALMQFPDLRSIIECDFNGYGDPTLESGQFDIIVDADETNLTGTLTLGPMPMVLEGTMNATELNATFYGEGSDGSGRDMVMEGTMVATKL